MGCGIGSLVAHADQRHLDAWGIEPNDMGELFQAPGRQIHMDISVPIDLGVYDMVICLEVIEHIPSADEDVVLDNLARHCNKVLWFSGAIPDQGGIGHVNERPHLYWINKLCELGFYLEETESRIVRGLCNLPSIRKNSCVFIKKGA